MKRIERHDIEQYPDGKIGKVTENSEIAYVAHQYHWDRSDPINLRCLGFSIHRFNTLTEARALVESEEHRQARLAVAA